MQQYESKLSIEINDGGLILEMDVQGLEELKRWILQYGGEVEVVEPNGLLDEVRKKIKKMDRLYSELKG